MKLKQAMRNITCGDQQILFMVIWLVLTRVENGDISYSAPISYVSSTCLKGRGKSRTLLEMHILVFRISVRRWRCRKMG